MISDYIEHVPPQPLPQIQHQKHLYLVKDGEAIIVEDRKIEVFGEERIVGS